MYYSQLVTWKWQRDVKGSRLHVDSNLNLRDDRCDKTDRVVYVETAVSFITNEVGASRRGRHKSFIREAVRRVVTRHTSLAIRSISSPSVRRSDWKAAPSVVCWDPSVWQHGKAAAAAAEAACEMLRSVIDRTQLLSPVSVSRSVGRSTPASNKTQQSHATRQGTVRLRRWRLRQTLVGRKIASCAPQPARAPTRVSIYRHLCARRHRRSLYTYGYNAHRSGVLRHTTTMSISTASRITCITAEQVTSFEQR